MRTDPAERRPPKERPPGPVLVVNDVHVTYRVFEDRRPTLRKLVAGRFRPRTFRHVHAVRGISLQAHRGETIGVIGRNGSGKSTLLRAMAGLLPPGQGSIHGASLPLLLGVGAALHPALSGRRNIYLGGTALGMSRSEVARRFDEIVEFSGLRDFIEVPLRAYSTGMASRLQFAVASSVSPEILLIDEALNVGDREFQQKCQGRIRELTAGSGTVFLVTHSLQFVRDMCERTIWIDSGRVVKDGPSAEVLAEYEASTRGSDAQL